MNLGKKLKIGSLDRRITVNQETVAQDAYGQEISSSTTELDMWANINYQSGSEKSEAGQIASFKKMLFTVRYSSTSTTVTERDTIVFDSKTYRITAIGELPGSRQRFLLFQAELID